MRVDQLEGGRAAIRLVDLEATPLEAAHENCPVVGDIIDDQKTWLLVGRLHRIMIGRGCVQGLRHGAFVSHRFQATAAMIAGAILVAVSVSAEDKGVTRAVFTGMRTVKDVPRPSSLSTVMLAPMRAQSF